MRQERVFPGQRVYNAAPDTFYLRQGTIRSTWHSYNQLQTFNIEWDSELTIGSWTYPAGLMGFTADEARYFEVSP